MILRSVLPAGQAKDFPHQNEQCNNELNIALLGRAAILLNKLFIQLNWIAVKSFTLGVE